MKTCFISNMLIYTLVQELELCKKKASNILNKKN